MHPYWSTTPAYTGHPGNTRVCPGYVAAFGVAQMVIARWLAPGHSQVPRLTGWSNAATRAGRHRSWRRYASLAFAVWPAKEHSRVGQCPGALGHHVQLRVAALLHAIRRRALVRSGANQSARIIYADSNAVPRARVNPRITVMPSVRPNWSAIPAYTGRRGSARV